MWDKGPTFMAISASLAVHNVDNGSLGGCQCLQHTHMLRANGGQRKPPDCRRKLARDLQGSFDSLDASRWSISPALTDTMIRLSGPTARPPYSAIGYSHTYCTYVFQVSQGVVLYPPKFALSQPRGGGGQGVSQLKLPSRRYRTIRGLLLR